MHSYKRQSSSRRDPYEGVVLACPTTVPYQRYSIESAHWWIARAVRETLRSAGMTTADVDGFCVASLTLFPDNAVGLVQHLGLQPRWLDHAQMGGASGVALLRRAARAVQSGDADTVVCVGGDTNHIDSFRRLLSSFSRSAQDATYPYGYGGPNACFALLMDHYISQFGARREDFGLICVAQRANALRNPNAIMKKPLRIEDYLQARPIADPIGLLDCVMPVAGAEAFVVMREEDAAANGIPFARIRASIERHNAFPDDPVQIRGGWAMDVNELWQMADLTPEQIDVVMTYDDYPVIVMMQLEDLGFCKKGEGPAFIRSHDLTIDGSFPHNTSGGQLSGGQAGVAGGFLGIVEALRQVTGQAGSTQVQGARHALASGFGMVNYDRGACANAVILSGENS